LPRFRVLSTNIGSYFWLLREPPKCRLSVSSDEELLQGSGGRRPWHSMVRQRESSDVLCQDDFTFDRSLGTRVRTRGSIRTAEHPQEDQSRTGVQHRGQRKCGGISKRMNDDA
jgi:hypothetical protein